MVLADYKQELACEEPESIPAEAAMVISALDVGRGTLIERRRTGRFPYRTTAELKLFRDDPTAPSRTVYTRDINRRGMGFVTTHSLPLGYGGVVRLSDEHGDSVDVHCTLLRCREAAPGWFEGCATFNRDQPQFDR